MSVSYTHLDVYKRQLWGGRRCAVCEKSKNKRVQTDFLLGFQQQGIHIYWRQVFVKKLIFRRRRTEIN